MNIIPSKQKKNGATLFALAAALVTLSPVQAQDKAAPIGNIALLVPTQRIQVSAPLLKHLQATKTRVTEASLNKFYRVAENKIFFVLANGEEKQLLPLNMMEGTNNGDTSENAVADEVKDALPYIAGATISESVRTKIYKINPRLLIPLGVDRRSSMTPIRDQGPRGTCVAFASNAALEVFRSIPDDLSEQYTNDLFMRKENRQACEDGIRTIDAATYLLDGTVAEDKWAYTNSAPACNATPPAAANSAQKFKITSSQLIYDGGPTGAASIKNPRYLESLLRAGHNIVLGTHVAWGAANSNGVLDVVINPSTNQPAASRGGHAMLICGYNAAQSYFIVKNSWGSSWQHSGYGYLSYDYIRTYAKYGYFIRSVSPGLILNGSVLIDPDTRMQKTIRITPR